MHPNDADEKTPEHTKNIDFWKLSTFLNFYLSLSLLISKRLI